MPIIKIGADPELFLIDGNGHFFPATHVVPGTKSDPFKLEKGAVQVDGVAVEFNIDAAENEDQFVNHCQVVLSQINEMIGKFDKDLKLKCTPVAVFDEEVWKNVPEISKILGCDPDYNTDGEVNPNPSDLLEGQSLRTAAGHIHVGFLDELVDDPMAGEHFADCLWFAQGYYNANLPSYTPRTGVEHERLKYYGKNAFRPKKYGVELRAPSNVWVANEKSMRAIYSETRNHFKTLTGI